MNLKTAQLVIQIFGSVRLLALEQNLTTGACSGKWKLAVVKRTGAGGGGIRIRQAVRDYVLLWHGSSGKMHSVKATKPEQQVVFQLFLAEALPAAGDIHHTETKGTIFL